MGLQPDHWIRRMAVERQMIVPFVGEQVREGVISYGLSSYGYDIRVGDEFKIPVEGGSLYTDPKNQAARSLEDFKGPVCTIPPHAFVVARSLEYLRMPPDTLGLAFGKSTYTRCGIVPHFAPLEPGWHGTLTFTISNLTPHPAKVYANEGIAQVLFFTGDAACEISYADRVGKYQGQTRVTLARVEGGGE